MHTLGHHINKHFQDEKTAASVFASEWQASSTSTARASH